ncbi:hypothetical protein ACROYT_G014615 [Oculina patagonica]
MPRGAQEDGQPQMLEIAAISVDTGEVVDVVHLSSSCAKCKKMEKKKAEGRISRLEFLTWFNSHEPDCYVNHDGSSPSPNLKKLMAGDTVYFGVEDVTVHRFDPIRKLSQRDQGNCAQCNAAFYNRGSQGAHIGKAEEAVPVMSTHTLTKEIIDLYKSDQDTKDSLAENMNGISFPRL